MAGNNGSTFGTQNVNTPLILTPTTGDTVLVANSARLAWSIQNLGTNPLFIRLGTGATTLLFHHILPATTGSDDGTGASFSQEAGTIWTGAISVAGTNPRCVLIEMAP